MAITFKTFTECSLQTRRIAIRDDLYKAMLCKKNVKDIIDCKAPRFSHMENCLVLLRVYTWKKDHNNLIILKSSINAVEMSRERKKIKRERYVACIFSRQIRLCSNNLLACKSPAMHMSTQKKSSCVISVCSIAQYNVFT